MTRGPCYFCALHSCCKQVIFFSSPPNTKKMLSALFVIFWSDTIPASPSVCQWVDGMSVVRACVRVLMCVCVCVQQQRKNELTNEKRGPKVWGSERKEATLRSCLCLETNNPAKSMSLTRSHETTTTITKKSTGSIVIVVVHRFPR